MGAVISTSTGIQAPRSIYIAVGCIAAATLGFELTQTRVLSALYFHHVVYLTVTIALMGFGISGVIVSLIANRLNSPERFIALFSGLFAVSMVICIAIASRFPVWLPNASIIVKILLSYLLLVIPFLCSGAVLGMTFMRYGGDIARLYCFDLIASAIAAFAFIVLLLPLGAGEFIWLCVFLACAACILQSRHAKISCKPADILAFTMAFASIIFAGHIIGWKPEAYKTLGRIYNTQSTTRTLEETRWTPISRIDVVSDPYWDMLFNQPRSRNDEKYITQDGDARTFIASPPTVDWMLSAGHNKEVLGSISLPYLMQPTTPEALVIGVGGGYDIVIAKSYGAGHITGLEINPATFDLLSHRYADFAIWPHWKNVDLIRGEGRHFSHSKTNAYDTITMSAIDTWAALSSGAYVLSENYLYTVEAIEDYLNALKPNGIMVIFRMFFIQPRESIRLASLYMEAAHRMGIEHPEQSIFVVAQPLGNNLMWASTIIKKTPFTIEEMNRALPYLNNTNYFKVIYVPKIFPPAQQRDIETRLFRTDPAMLAPARNAYTNIINARSPESRDAFFSKYPFNIVPVYDDKPFFFDYFKWSPTSLWKQLLEQPWTLGSQGVLVLLFVLCTIISLSAMIVPLVIFNRDGLKTEGLLWLMLYFSSLGIGFMLVEIGMMQRLSLYLGDPMYALVVVLAGLLLCAGFGSYLSGQSLLPRNKQFMVGTLGTSVAVIVWLVCIPFIISLTQTLPFFARALFTILSILPVGILMGIPFATGLSHLQTCSVRFIPWAWGINGLTSVLASIIAIMIAMKIGFIMVLVVGALAYLFGFIAVSVYQSR